MLSLLLPHTLPDDILLYIQSFLCCKDIITLEMTSHENFCCVINNNVDLTRINFHSQLTHVYLQGRVCSPSEIIQVHSKNLTNFVILPSLTRTYIHSHIVTIEELVTRMILILSQGSAKETVIIEFIPPIKKGILWDGDANPYAYKAPNRYMYNQVVKNTHNCLEVIMYGPRN
jgi:hypothetical protein